VAMEDQSVSIAFDSESGALTRLENKSTHWMAERRPDLGVSFRLFAPLPNRRYNPVFGQKQHAAKVTKISDHEIKFQWQELISENGGTLPMTLTADVTLADGALVFKADLENDSPLVVETIDYPYFGDFNSPARNSSLTALTATNATSSSLQADELYPHFRNEKGYWGVNYPTKMSEAAQNFCLIQAPNQGLYCGLDASTMPYHLQYTFEQHPGVISAVNNLVPQADEFSGYPVHLEYRFCHFIFAEPHSTTNLVPIVLRFYSGDSRTGAALSKQLVSIPAH
jgi:hypothetical protein